MDFVMRVMDKVHRCQTLYTCQFRKIVRYVRHPRKIILSVGLFLASIEGNFLFYEPLKG